MNVDPEKRGGQQLIVIYLFFYKRKTGFLISQIWHFTKQKNHAMTISNIWFATSWVGKENLTDEIN